MKKITGFLLVLLAAALIGGCIDYTEILELNADGSGTMSMQVVVHKKFFDAFDQMMGSVPDTSVKSDSNDYGMFKREDIEKQIADSKLKIKLVDFTQQNTDSTLISNVKFSFTDFSDMMKMSQQMGKAEVPEEESPKKKVTFLKSTDGLWNYARDFQDSSMNMMMEGLSDTSALSAQNPTAEGDSTTDSLAQGFGNAMAEMSKTMAKMMVSAFSDCHMRMAVKFPGKIVKTNATKVEGNTAIWEYKLNEIPKAPKQLEASVQM